MPFTCQRAKFTTDVRVLSANPIKTVKVFSRQGTVALRKVRFRSRYQFFEAQEGQGHVRVDGIDVTGKAFSIKRTFKRCLVSLLASERTRRTTGIRTTGVSPATYD